MDKIVLIDPSLQNNKGILSTNLGDCIINESIVKYLKEIFPKYEIFRISSHTPLEKIHFEITKKANFIFIGGTNILSSNIKVYNQWELSNAKYYYLYPKVRNIVLFGVGWWQYQAKPTFLTKLFYNRVLNKNIIHSLRDNYTKQMLDSINVTNALNTTCPTCWELNGRKTNRKEINISTCVFSLTDYNRNIQLDTQLIKLLLHYYPEKLLFFPQGINDLEYINSLDVFKQNRQRFELLKHSITIFEDLRQERLNYVGTRLHGGVKFLQMSKESLIIGIDNRAVEIQHDINLPVVKRDELNKIKEWLEGNSRFNQINLPLNNIEKWKNQFSVK